MIIPVIKGLSSPQLDRPALPADPENCAILCEIEIGPKDGEGADLFHMTVATPTFFLRSGGVTWGRGHLIVDQFSWSAIDQALEKLCLHAWRSTWHEVAQELNKELHWEFENYTPAKPNDR
jgi:hypothetical protein